MRKILCLLVLFSFSLIGEAAALGSGLEEVAGKKLVSVYPNPFAESVNTSFAYELFNTYRELSLTIYDASGRLIISKSGLKKNSIRITNQELSKGSYIYILGSETGVIERGKLIKQ